QGDSPSADEIVRLARALRGSALMASQPAIARAAAGLEVLARAVREGRRAWDPQTQQLALRAVDDLKIFVRRAGSWTDADTAKAEALAVELEQVAGRPSAQIRAVEALGLDAGAHDVLEWVVSPGIGPQRLRRALQRARDRRALARHERPRARIEPQGFHRTDLRRRPAGDLLELDRQRFGFCGVGIGPAARPAHEDLQVVHRAEGELLGLGIPGAPSFAHRARQDLEPGGGTRNRGLEIGRASCRERVL